MIRRNDSKLKLKTSLSLTLPHIRLYVQLYLQKRIYVDPGQRAGQAPTRVSPELQPTRVATGGEYELARGVEEKGRQPRQKIDSAPSGHVYLTLRPVVPAAADLLSELDARQSSQKDVLFTFVRLWFDSLTSEATIKSERQEKRNFDASQKKNC